MTKYAVQVVMDKVVIVTAANEDEARDKAEAKVNTRSDKWMAETVWQVA